MIPVSTAGTACSVSHCTVVALWYQVESRASAAKFGKRVASTCPRRSMSDPDESSLKTITTTDVRDFTAMDLACASSGKTSFDTGELKRKRARKTSGAGARNVRNVRIAPARR